MRLSCLIFSCALVVASPPALAVMRYGVAAGPATPLRPSDTVGGVVGLSATLSGSDTLDEVATLLRLRGELLGLLTSDSKALLPTLTGDIGFEAGALHLFLTGGVQIFGVASRADTTVFATLGFTGGIGLSTPLRPKLRLTVRGTVTWLAPFANAVLSSPEGKDSPSYFFLCVLVGVEYLPVAATRSEE
jgi:hypothetical protein